MSEVELRAEVERLESDRGSWRRVAERLESELAEARKALRIAEFASNGYCPECSGWEVRRGQGCMQRAHTKNCRTAKILAAAPAEPKGDGGHTA